MQVYANTHPTQVGGQYVPTPFTAPNATAASSAFEGLHNRLTVQVSRVWDLRDKARAIADDVFGPAPQAQGTTGGKQEPALGRYSQIATALDSLDFALTALSIETDRLTCL